MTLRDYVTGPRASSRARAFPVSGSICAREASIQVASIPAAAAALSNRFAQLFGVEQADIDQMNLAPDQGGCPGGSPFASPQAGAFNRDDTFLEQAISVNKSQVEGNLFNGNEASLRLDFNPGSKDRLFGAVQLGKVNGSVHWQR